MGKTLAIITVNYNYYEITDSFIKMLRRINSEVPLFIADLSTQTKKIEGNNLHVVTGENKGYAHGINLCLNEAVNRGYERFVVINNDTRVADNFIEASSHSLTSHPKSLIGGKIYYEKGYEYHECLEKDKGKVIWYAGGKFDFANMYTTHRGVNEVDHGQYERCEKTEFITGCLMLFDKQVLDKIGLWDESYFLYYEDADYCMRAAQKGISVYYDPTLVIWHQNSQSTGGSGSSLHQKYQSRNQLKFGLKYAPFRTKFHLLKNYFIK